ncbi:purine-nucleoside phosphorylase [Belliella kenyensis]|uniref:Purine nucleoside phosphorylase n=1 Tax=Belliella kenyensis TaxID=1472724 RepID=A0ABV8ELW6_9BACT|nr:purine-nucleoside phosphorylase [Belliella kenyensis]MCH7403770.1 purine-nucleoside phosphorylase [Belliella kenyensis]MDN3602446.1 purine-nucleoside phosphorylase [Belliella kenyensis]
MKYLDKAKASVAYIQSQTEQKADTLVILGSGLGGFVEILEDCTTLPYSQIPYFPVSTVEGHSGELILGKVGDKWLWVMNGRFHYYEGYELEETVFPLRVLILIGLKKLIVSNAAGGLNPAYRVGDLMLITDHIDKFPSNALRGKDSESFGVRFPDMSEPYDLTWRNLAKEKALTLGINLKEGTYTGVTGPSLETKTEIKYYRKIGGDAVGMSTVPEVIAARQMNIKVLALSVITNECEPGDNKTFAHEDVVEVAKKAGERLRKLVELVLMN